MIRRSTMNFNRLIKTTFSILLSFIGNKLGIMGPALLLFILLMILDYISGMLASRAEALKYPNNPKYGWSSKKSIIGIYKKIGYMTTILVAIYSDYVIFNLLEEIGIPYNIKTIFGLLVTIWFIINELLSILENAERMGVKLPKFILNVLTNIRDDIDTKTSD